MAQPVDSDEPLAISKHRTINYFAPNYEFARHGKNTEWLEHKVSGPHFDATKEEQIRIPLALLGEHVQNILKGCQRLHFRWVQPDTYDSLDPLGVRVSPGLHVFFTPVEGEAIDARHVCQMINELFGIEACEDQEAFIVIPHSKIKAKYTSANQLYYPLKSIRSVDTPILDGICGSSKNSCKAFFESLPSAASFDLFWDLDLPVLYLTSVWPLETRRLHERPYNDCTSQVAVLYHPDEVPGMSSLQVSLDGHVYDFYPRSQPEMQGFAPDLRHRKHPGNFSITLLKPTGLHPMLQLHMNSSRPPSGLDSCKMYAYLTLPKYIFADRYQLQDKLFLQSKNLAALVFSSDPVDLEAPAYAVKTWGSSVLLELAPDADLYRDNAWKAQIPLHLRYMEPHAGGYAQFDLPYPAVFWTCEVPVPEHIARVDPREYLPPNKEPDHDRMLSNAWDVVNIGYDALFPTNTSFWHLRPSPKSGLGLYSPVVVPVADSDKVEWVGVGTAFAVALGTSWVIWKLFKAWYTGLGSDLGSVTEKVVGKVDDGESNNLVDDSADEFGIDGVIVDETVSITEDSAYVAATDSLGQETTQPGVIEDGNKKKKRKGKGGDAAKEAEASGPETVQTKDAWDEVVKSQTELKMDVVEVLEREQAIQVEQAPNKKRRNRKKKTGGT